MAKKNHEENFHDDDFVVEMTDADGNVFYYTEELIIPVDGENFALLVAVPDEENFDDEEDEVIIAKIILNENGEEEYIEPTDEEFERVQAAYEKLTEETDEY